MLKISPMALSSSGMFVFDEALPLSPEDCLRLRQWMFSTDYHDAGVTAENRTKSSFLHQTEVRSQNDEKAPTRIGGEESEASGTTGEFIQDLRHHLHAADLELLTSREAATSLLSSAVDADHCKEAAAGNIPVSGLTAFETDNVASHVERAVASLRTDRRLGGAECCRKTDSAVRCEAADGVMPRKRMRKQPGLLPSVNKICGGSLSEVRSNTSPTARTHRFSISGAARGTTFDPAAGFFQPPPGRTKARAEAMHAEAVATDCCSEVIEDTASSLKVVVRKGNVRITKRFSPTDHRDRLPDLMFHLEQVCPFISPATAASTDGSLAATALSHKSAPAAPPAENPQDVPHRCVSAARANVTATVDSDPPQVPAPSHSHEKATSSGGDVRCKSFITEEPIAKRNRPENACAFGAKSRVKAGAQLYRDWVCKHFDQVHHYLSCSESYLQPDARRRERAASLALHLLLNLPRDSEQQSYLHWVTGFLNALSPNGNAETTSTKQDRFSEQQKSSVHCPHNAADRASAANTRCPRSTLRHTPPGALCSNSGTILSTHRAGVSPEAARTPPSTKLSDANNSPYLDAVGSSSVVKTPVSHIPSDASNVAAVAAQLLDSLRMVDPTEHTSRCAHQALASSRDALLPSKVSDVQLPQGYSGATREKATAHETKKSQRQYNERCFRFHVPESRITDAVAAAAATPLQSRDMPGHLAASERFAGAAAGNVDAFERARVMAAAPDTTKPAIERSSASTYVQFTPVALAGASEAYRGGGIPTKIIGTATGAAATSSASGATSETREVEPKAETPVLASDADFVITTEGSVCTTPELRSTAALEVTGDTAAGLPKQAVKQAPDYSAVWSTLSQAPESTTKRATRDALADEIAAAAAAHAPTVFAAGAPGQSSADASEVLAEPKPAQVGFEGSSITQKGEPLELRYPRPVTHADDTVVLSDEALRDEVFEAANAFVKSFPHEEDALAWLGNSNFFSMLQMLQLALEQAASNDAQQASQGKQPRVLQYGQQPKLRQACREEKEHQGFKQTQGGGAVGELMQERCAEVKQQNKHLSQQQERAEQPMQQDQLAEALLGVKSQQEQLQKLGENVEQQHGEKTMERIWDHDDNKFAEVGRHRDQKGDERFFKRLVTSRTIDQKKPQAQETPEEKMGLSADNSICTLLYSLLQKRLPTTSETFLDHESMLLQETRFPSHDTDCSSQNSRKVSSCAEDFLVQAGNALTSKESFSALSDGDSQIPPLSGWRSNEDAVDGAFPCYMEDRTAAPESDCSSFCSRSTSSTSACASIGVGSTCWPFRNNLGHSEQHELMREKPAPRPAEGFCLPAEEAGHSSADTETYSTRATAAVVG